MLLNLLLKGNNLLPKLILLVKEFFFLLSKLSGKP